MLWNVKNATVPVEGGVMSYVSFGRGERAFVILPGLSDGLATVKGKALLLAPPYKAFFGRYTVYMFSRRDPLPRGFTIRDMAADQAEAMTALGIARASVMGVSQGGMIAQVLAAEHPETVEKLVLAVTAPHVSPMIRENAERWMDLARQGDHRGLMTDTAERSYSPAYLRKYRRLYPLLGLVGRPKDYGRFLANAEAILSFEASTVPERIACPTLIIGGEEDRIVGICASRELHERIGDSRLFVYPGLGHAVYEEAEDFNARVLRFLDGESE